MNRFISNDESDRNAIEVTAIASLLASLVLVICLGAAAHFLKISDYLRVKNLYLLGIVLVLPLCLAGNKIASFLISSVSVFGHSSIQKAITAVYGMAFVYYFKYQKASMSMGLRVFLMVMAVLLVWGISVPKKIPRLAFVARIVATLTLFSQFAVLLFSYTYGFLRFPGTIGNAGFQIDFNTTFYSIVQVLLGALPFFDYQAQYGQYAVFFIPLRHLPLSLEALVLILASLVVVVGLGIFFASQTIFKNRTLRNVVLALIPCNLFFKSPEPYWPTLPIRLVFPCLIFLGAIRYFVGKTQRSYWLTMGLVVIAPLWNLDTGIPAMISWLLALSLDRFVDSPNIKTACRKIVKPWAQVLSLQMLAVLVFSSYCFILKGKMPVLSDAFRFQRSFFANGFGALSLIPFDSWITVPFCYITSFCYCIWAIGNAKERSKPMVRIVFFLTLFGSGILSYFIMRSHIHSLIVVSWPALILVGILTDHLLSSSDKQTRITGLLSTSLLAFLWINSSAFFASALNFTSEPGLAALRQQETFIRGLGLQEKPVLIISDKSSLFHFDLRSRSPLPIPSASEILASNEDIQIVKHYIESSSSSPRLIIYDKQWYLAETAQFQFLVPALSRFKLMATSPDGNLLFFTD